MPKQSQSSRRLAAILFADIQGYTALMQRNEAMASSVLNRFQEVMKSELPRYNGKIVNEMGDGMLCTFDAPVEAVRCAMALQEKFGEDPKVPVRLGIHAGTVVFEKEKVYGDSVNIASRIESIGVPGAILINSELLSAVSLIYINYGDFELANAYCAAAMELEPDNLGILGAMHTIQSYLGDFDEAMIMAQKMNAIEKDNLGLVFIALTHLYQKDYVNAEAFFEKYYALPEAIHIHAYLNHQRSAYAYVLRKNGKEKEAMEQIKFTRDLLLERAEQYNYDMSYDLAKCYSFLGEKEKALDYIEAFRPWYGLHSWIKSDPLFDNIKEESRFRAVVQRCDIWADSMRTVVATGLAKGLFPDAELLNRIY